MITDDIQGQEQQGQNVTATETQPAPASTGFALPEEMEQENEIVGPVEGEEQAAAEGEKEWDQFTYKVRGEEKEFDEWAKAYVKDDASYKNFQEMYTRADGLELAKTERDTFKGKLEGIENDLQQVSAMINNGDIGGFIQALKLPEKQIMDYAINKLRYAEASPEEKAAMDHQNNQTQQFHQMQYENQTLQQQLQNQQQSQQDFVRNQRANELNMGLTSPEVASVAQQYDSKMGQGAFRQRVIERGIVHAQNNQDIPVHQAISEAMQILNLQVGTPENNQAAVGTQQQQVAQGGGARPVLPHFRGRGTSPLKAKPQSIQDLIRLRDQRIQPT